MQSAMSLRTIFSHYGTGVNQEINLFGTEYEVESIKNTDKAMVRLVGSVFVELDNSLRNHGLEFKTKPMDLKTSVETFSTLFDNLIYHKKSEAFSDRTSIHIHLNVGDLSLEQAKELVLLYALLEPVFFSYVAKERHNSIFCVPLGFTTLHKRYKQDFKNMVDLWHKYTAFNILPVKNFGTIEFRHLQGTDDFNTYCNWITAIDSLKKFTISKSFSVLEYLEQGRSIKNLALQVVPSICKELSEEMFYNSVLDVKLSKGELV